MTSIALSPITFSSALADFYSVNNINGDTKLLCRSLTRLLSLLYEKSTSSHRIFTRFKLKRRVVNVPASLTLLEVVSRALR